MEDFDSQASGKVESGVNALPKAPQIVDDMEWTARSAMGHLRTPTSPLVIQDCLSAQEVKVSLAPFTNARVMVTFR